MKLKEYKEDLARIYPTQIAQLQINNFALMTGANF